MIDARTVVRRTMRVPLGDGKPGDGAGVARQMDAALVGMGFKASRELLEHIAGFEPRSAMDIAYPVVRAARELVGDNVPHNAYFIRFPKDVPDTVEFWVKCMRDALMPVPADGWVNLLELPTYGTYQHTYEELLAAHDELIPSVKDRVTVVHLGGTLAEESALLFQGLAASVTPLGEADLALLEELAGLTDELPQVMPVRENRAVVNSVRLAAGQPLVLVDTVTDVLRVACHASGGDVTLQERTKFRGFKRRERRVLMAALDDVIAADTGKLGDIARFAEPWKRLGERLHPHEYPQFPHAADVFAVARGERKVRSLAARAEHAYLTEGAVAAAAVLANAPGMLVRSMDRLLRETDPAQAKQVLDVVEKSIGAVSGRVLCSVRQHLANRATPDSARVFATRGRRAWVADDTRKPLSVNTINSAVAMVDAELLSRVPSYERIVVHPDVFDVAVPLSGKATEDGFAVLPRGTRTPVDGDVLRFFTYWRQRSERTDYDLSVLLLNKDFQYVGHVSWTNYDTDGAVYSGDITEAKDGATEFIDIELDAVSAKYIVPQVHIYSGESFEQVAESMFGWMTRERGQEGAPFEPRTVRTRSDMRGYGRVALPIVFGRDDDGEWTGTWTHLYQTGQLNFNRVEGAVSNSGRLARAVYERRYLTMSYLINLLTAKAGSVTVWEPGMRWDEPVVFIGMDRPEDLPECSTVFTRDRLNRLVPA
ncbi:TerD family protein [Actinosynnema sp. ALI-1.44]|uniref:TerD family protein n=1 Tax=Actinosynnema sp. ALI-1.44 TaxID=1933779 RepID=UPI00192CF880|nr:TerD family protein [Actinosynnema sp. ALI-1.44]